VHVDIADGRTTIADVLGPFGFLSGNTAGADRAAPADEDGRQVGRPPTPGTGEPAVLEDMAPNLEPVRPVSETSPGPRAAAATSPVRALLDDVALDGSASAAEVLYEGAHVRLEPAGESDNEHRTRRGVTGRGPIGQGVPPDPTPNDPTLDPAFDLIGVDGEHAGHVWRLAPGMHHLQRLGLAAEASLRVEGDDISLLAAPGSRTCAPPARGTPPSGHGGLLGRDLFIGASRFRIDRAEGRSWGVSVGLVGSGGSDGSGASGRTPGASRLGPVTFNRPPRTLRPMAPVNIPCPRRVVPQGKGRRISVIMIVLPILFGVSMALFFGRLMFLAFALMGPLMMIGNTVDDRRRRRRDVRDNETTFRIDLAAFEERLRAASTERRRWTVAAHPPPGALLMRLELGVTTLWQRRPDHGDFMELAVGCGDLPWREGIEPNGEAAPEVTAAIRHNAVTPDAPITLHLRSGRIAGLHGRRDRAVAAARSLLAQIAYWHGPADVRVAVLTDHPADWDWIKWLPHVRASDGEIRLLAAHAGEIGTILSFLRTRPAGAEQIPLTVLVSDVRLEDPELVRLHREVLAGAGCPLSGIVLAESVDELPGSCTDLVDVGPVDIATNAGGPEIAFDYTQPAQGTAPMSVRPWTMSPAAACEMARAMARFDDPEALAATADLPTFSRLAPLFQLGEVTPDVIVSRWKAAAPGRLRAPIGAVAAGPLSIDLVADGPHGLIAGTTGSGKSELLRSLVASLAAAYPPEQLAFVLVDYKGGSAFDACAALPHVAGMVTDLDEHLGARALTCLEAELRYREARLREAAVSDVTEYQRLGPAEPLPRMVIVIDEFAALAADLPDFMGALVDIAQRGRSLGVHLVLATQRPSGVVKDSIRANTNLRISLRVQTPADSNDVLADPAAARIPRDRPGRAILRLGPGELVAFQSAMVTGPASGDRSADRIRVTPFTFSMRDPAATPHAAAGGVSELQVLVDAIGVAAETTGATPTRTPWPDPLPPIVSRSQVPSDDGAGFALGLRDEPEHQRRVAHLWDPGVDGNMLLVGSTGPTMAMRALVAEMTRAHPDDLHIYAIDHRANGISAIGGVPHVGALIPGHDRERQERLLRFLLGEIDHRRRAGRCSPRIVFLLDGLAGYRAAFDDVTELDMREMLERVIETGPPTNVFTVVGAPHARAVPGTMLASVRTRIVFRLADRLDYSTLGVTERSIGELPDGRGLDASTGRHVQVATVSDAELACPAHLAGTPRSAPPIDVLPEHVKLSEILHVAGGGVRGLVLPIGLDDRTLQPAVLSLEAGDHALITGTPRSGKSTLLATLAQAAAHADPRLCQIALCPRPSPLRNLVSFDRPTEDLRAAIGPGTRSGGAVRDADPGARAGAWLAHSLKELADLAERTAGRPRLILIDDADDIEDADDLLETLLAARDTGDRVVAAGRSDGIRAAYRHWTRAFRSARRGVVLQPIDAGDAEPLGVRLPRRLPTNLPVGRGYLTCDGTVRLVQSALGDLAGPYQCGAR
jgi:S-DNA-T family DNA segregation ATPase FtsK/SpoIIIE